MTTKTWINAWVLCFAATITGATAFAQGDYTWNAAFPGTWNTSTANWSGSTWANGGSSNAVFNNPNGTVTLTEAITAGSLGFNTGGTPTGGHELILTGSTLSLGSVSVWGGYNGNLGNGGVDNIAQAYDQRLRFQNMTVNASGGMSVRRGMLYLNSATVNVGGVISGVDAWNVFREDNSTVTATGGIDLSVIASQVELYGGTVTTPFVKVGNAAFNGTGGLFLGSGVTLVPTGTSADYLQVFNNGDPGSRAAATLTSGGMTLDTTYAVTVATQLNGSGSLTKSGAGTLQLTAESTYSGGTIVNAGTLLMSNNGGRSRIGGALTVNAGGTVEVTGDGTGLGFLDQISSVAINDGTVTSAGTMHVWNISGGITMAGGTLQSNNGVSNSDGGALAWNRTSVTTNASANTSTIGGRIWMRNDSGYGGILFTVADGAAATDLLVSAAITENSGGMGITKAGAGTMVFSAINTYTGTTTVNGGTLELAGATGGNGLIRGALTVNSGATLAITGGDTTGFGWNNPISSLSINGGTVNAVGGSHLGFGSAVTVGLNNGGTIAGSWQWNGDGGLAFSTSGDSTNTINGSLNLRSDNGGNHTFNVANGAAAVDLQVNATLSDAPPYEGAPVAAVVKSGAGTMVLNAVNSYRGGTTLSAGRLVAGNAAAFGSGGVSLGSGATLDLGGYAVSNSITNSGGSLLNAASYIGSQSVVGTTSLTGTVGGSLTVNSGGTLKGSATTFTGPVVIAAGGVHSPGNSPGSQAFTSGLAYSGSSALTWELIANTTSGPGTNYDVLSVTGGNLTIDSSSLLSLEFLNTGSTASTVNWGDSFWDTPQTWTIIDFTSGGSSTGVFTLAGDATTWLDSGSTSLASARPNSSFSVANVNGDVVLSYAIIVPEPSSIALVGLGGLLAAAALRRRRA